MSINTGFSPALKSGDGSAWAWGLGTSGQLGDNTITSKSSPVSVVGAHSFNAIGVGNAYSLALKSNDGSAWAWGTGTTGQLGDNTILSKSSPVSVVGAHSFNAIGAGNTHSLALKSNDGSAWAWGAGTTGQLGDNTILSKSSPVSVVGAHSFNAITGGSNNSLALKSNDGSAWAWGTGTSGQLGDNTVLSKSSPVSVVGAHSFNAIASENTTSLALKSNDGSAWAWGVGTSGQLGDNTILSKSSPVSVVGAHSFNAIARGSAHFFALKSNNGSAWAWGINDNGRLGDNTILARSSPVSVVGAHSFNAIAGGGTHSLALKSNDGSAWAWGVGTSGQLGDNTEISKSSPVSVVGAHSFIEINAGNVNSYALKSDGSIWSWGSRTSGALGNNTSDTFNLLSSPVQVVIPATAIKTISGLPYLKYIYNDISTGAITVTSVKTINATAIASIKTVEGQS